MLLPRRWFPGVINAASVAGGGGNPNQHRGLVLEAESGFFGFQAESCSTNPRGLRMILTTLLWVSFPVPKLKQWLDLGGGSAGAAAPGLLSTKHPQSS